jgi:hypothetical protein
MIFNEVWLTYLRGKRAQATNLWNHHQADENVDEGVGLHLVAKSYQCVELSGCYRYLDIRLPTSYRILISL